MCNKSTSFLAILLLLSLFSRAQSYLDSLASRYDSLQTYVTYGILADRNPASLFIGNWVDPLEHTGLIDSTLHIGNTNTLLPRVFSSV